LPFSALDLAAPPEVSVREGQAEGAVDVLLLGGHQAAAFAQPVGLEPHSLDFRKRTKPIEMLSNGGERRRSVCGR